MAFKPLHAHAVDFAYDRARPVLAGVSLSLAPGRVTAIVGPNGAGKTTLLRLLLGVLTPTAGSVRLDGVPLSQIDGRLRARRMAYIPQRGGVAFGFSVREVIGLGALAGTPDRRAADREAGAALALVALADRAEEPFATLSLGQQQRAVLGRALAQLRLAHRLEGGHTPFERARAEPDAAAPSDGAARDEAAACVLLADEPISAMDPSHALATLALLCRATALGLAVAIVLHDLTLAARWADDALLLDANGRAAASGPTADVLAPEVLARVFGVPFVRVDAGPAAGALVMSATGRPPD